MVSFCIAAHNEAAVIGEKITNTLSLNYPADRIEIIIGSDGSTDDTTRIVSRFNDRRIRLIAMERHGKNLTLNSIVEQTTGSILVFSDADAKLDKNALINLVSRYIDDRVGGVAGNIRYESGGRKNKGERMYWLIEHLQKLLLGKSGNATSATGQLYSIRRKLYKPIPRGVTDDFVISAQVIAAGYRLSFAPDAIAYCPQADTSSREFSRKVRIFSGGLRGVWHVRKLCNPFRYGFFSLQLISHKLLRRLIVFPLILLIPSNAVLLSAGSIYRWCMIAQTVFHGFAMIGFLFSRTALSRFRLFALPLYFDLTYYAVLVALVEIFFGKKHDLWSVNRHHENG